MNAVEIRGVTKRFGAQTAVDDLDLDVPANSIYGFIGPNGSGKTTTLRMIMRILLPDAGTVRVLGEETWKAASDRVTYLPEERGLYKQMRADEVLEFYARLKGHPNPAKSVAAWLDRMGLSAHARKKVSELSKGMAQKVQFISAVVSEPQLVLLDEPFSGLDPINGEVVRDAVLDLKRSGTTVIFSTHDMAVAERMCDFVFMIYRGKKVLDGTLASIQDRYGEDTVRVRLGGGATPQGVPGVAAVTDFGNLQELRLSPGADPQAVLAALVARGEVRHFEVARPSLRDIFVRVARPEPEGERDAE